MINALETKEISYDVFTFFLEATPDTQKIIETENLDAIQKYLPASIRVLSCVDSRRAK